jgi:hypothetical protein
MVKRKGVGKLKATAKPKGVVKSKKVVKPKRVFTPKGVVHLMRELPRPQEGEPDNTYWAIGGSQHETVDAVIRQTSYLPWSFGEHALRNDLKCRGLLNYKNCKVTELKGFFEARGIKLPTGRRYKVDFIAALQKADDEAKFTKFFDLPAELRSMVATKYMEDLPILPRLPHQPPLTLASSSLRIESLPLYYRDGTFNLSFTTTWDHLVLLRTGPTLTTLHKDSVALLARIPAHSLGRVRKLRLQLYQPARNHIFREHWMVKWDVELSGSGAEPMITNTTISLAFGSAQTHLQTVGRALEAALRAVRARPGFVKLGLQDGDGLAAALQQAFVALGRVDGE